VLRRAYYLAYAYTETDDGDLTYFVLHQLAVMRAALEELLAHLTERSQRLRALAKLVASFDRLNHRQRSLLEHALRHPNEGQSIDAHATSHGVHYMTARNDLAELETLGLMLSKRVRKVKRYYPAQALLTSAAANQKA
jgi:Fic family protein